MTKLTILMYHEVATPRAGTRHLGNFVTPGQFDEQLDALRAWRYESIGFDDWLAFRRGVGRLPARPVILTFDDAYQSFAREAWPRLKARGMGATLFVVAGQLGGRNVWDADELPSPLLDAREIAALRRDGVVVGSHTRSHVPLAKVPAQVAREELVTSRALLEDAIGAPVRLLSYPYSNQNRAVRALARDAGYVAAVRGKGRMNHRLTSPFALRRIKFDVHSTPRDMQRKLFRARWLEL